MIMCHFFILPILEARVEILQNKGSLFGDLKIPKFHSEINSSLVHIGGFFSKPLTKNVICSLAY